MSSMSGRAPSQRRVLCKVDLPDGSACLVLYDWMSYEEKRPQNLVCLEQDGALRWHAELPADSAPDCYVACQIADGSITANTVSCYLVALEAKTGRILHRTFTK